MKALNRSHLLWVGFGAAYGIAMRLLFSLAPHFEVISIAFMLGTPFVVGAITVFGLRDNRPTVMQMMGMPLITIGCAMLGAAVSFLEGSICIVLASPVLMILASLGGLVMGFVLRWTNKGETTLKCLLMLPIALSFVEPSVPQQPKILEERVSIDVAAKPHRIWREIVNARDIRKEELPWNFTHFIGVPRPVEGINVMTKNGEVRYSKWERGVNFEGHVTQKIPDRTITWKYVFTDASFPPGSMDDHVKIGGRYFDLYDTTFNLVPVSKDVTRLEIISHYKVSTSINFYGVPVARWIAKDFMTTIVELYKSRSERHTS